MWGNNIHIDKKIKPKVGIRVDHLSPGQTEGAGGFFAKTLITNI